MCWILLVIILLILFYLWSACLPLYHEKTEKLISDESKCFDPGCKSIVIRQDSGKAVLMIHGYPTTPAMYRYAAERLREAGWDVYAPLIPSFGTDWHDFEKTNFSSWYAWIEGYYRNLRKEYSTVCVIGTSMGGAMALKLAEREKPDAIVTVGAPVVYNSLFRDYVITDWISYLGRIIALFIPSLGAGIVKGKPESNDGNEEWLGYKGQFPRQGVSLIWNLKAIRKNLAIITSPVLSIHDKGDRTVPFANQGIIRREIKAEAEFIVTEMGEECHHTHHALLMYHSVQAELMDKIIAFLSSHTL